MLYKYYFVKKHKMHKLNQHLLYFIRRIRTAKNNASFIPAKYFHADFLNKDGKIAPNRKENKSLTASFKVFFDTYKQLSQELKDEFYNIVLFSMSLPIYFGDESIDVSSLHKDNIRRIIGNETFENLMETLWNNLKTNSWEIDKHYQEFYDNLPSTKVCPFCGINQLSSPKSYRADYDHIAFKGDYPLSSINLKNIAPSCCDCNQRFKHSKNVFYKDNGTRRSYVYPYTSYIDIELDFKGTILPNTDINNAQGRWEVSFIPYNSSVETWEYIYEIKQRYADEVLNVDYKVWIDEFEQEISNYSEKATNVEQLKAYFLKFYNRYADNKLQKRYLIKSSLFKYFSECNNNLFYNQIIRRVSA